MTTETCLAELRRMLADAGFDESAPDLPDLWPIWKAWAAIPVEKMDPEEDEDMLLFECSLDLAASDTYGDGPAFIVGLTRQFIHSDEDGEYVGMEQLGVDFRYPLHDDFQAITTMAHWSDTFGTADSFWGNGAHKAAAWCERVERTRSYDTALRHRPFGVSIGQGDT